MQSHLHSHRRKNLSRENFLILIYTDYLANLLSESSTNVKEVYHATSVSFWSNTQEPVLQILKNGINKIHPDFSLFSLTDLIQSVDKNDGKFLVTANFSPKMYLNMPSESLDILNQGINNIKLNQPSPLWFNKELENICNGKSSYVFIDRSSKNICEERKAFSLFVSMRANQVYYKAVSDKISHISCPEIQAVIPKEILNKEIDGVNQQFVEDIEVFIIPTISVWNIIKSHKSKKLEHISIIGITLTYFFSNENLLKSYGDAKPNGFHFFKITNALDIAFGSQLRVLSDYHLLKLNKNSSISPKELHFAFGRMIMEMTGTNTHSDSDENLRESIVQTRMHSFVLGSISFDGQPAEPFQLKEIQYNDISGHQKTLVSFLGNILQPVPKSLDSELKNKELFLQTQRDEIISRNSEEEFFHASTHMLLSYGYESAKFPDSSFMWWIAMNVLLIENLSSQLATIYQYDHRIRSGSSLSFKEMITLRREQIEDLESIYNIQTTDWIYMEKVEKIKESLGIMKRYEKIKEKIEFLSSAIFVDEQVKISEHGQKLDNALSYLTIGFITITLFIGFGTSLITFYTFEHNILYLMLAIIFLAIASGVTVKILLAVRNSTKLQKK